MLGDGQRYRLGGLLGRGGMAEVFEGHAIGSSGVTRRVAVKRLLDASDVAATRMFLDEATIASSLHHGNIVALLDYGIVDGAPFQVLEWVDGYNASHLQKLGAAVNLPMPVEIALHLVVEIALGLEYAHTLRDASGQPLSVVHRDVKPSNILVSWNGDVKLGDFGIAFAQNRSEKTLDGSVKGTPAYMAPEQLRGAAVDARTDIFALGCTLAALCTGVSPMSKDENASRALRGEEPLLDPELQPDVASLVAKATRVSPSDRYGSAAQFAEEAANVLADRIRRSPRALLVEWLGRLRTAAERDPPPKTAPKRALFDDLMGVDLAPDPSVPHKFVADQLPATRVHNAPIAPPSVHTETADLRVTHRPKRGRIIAGAVGFAAVGGVLAFVLAVGQGETKPSSDLPAPPSTQSPAATGTSESAPSSPSSDLTPTSSSVHTAPTTSQVPFVGSVARSASPSPVEPVNTAPSVAVSAAPSPSPSDAVTTGFLVIRGPGSVGAEVLVNGTSRGFAPKKIEVPLGSYSVSLVQRDGTRLGPRSITVTARNTPLSPAAWDVASP